MMRIGGVMIRLCGLALLGSLVLISSTLALGIGGSGVIAYNAGPDGRGDIFLLDVRTGVNHNLTAAFAPERLFVWYARRPAWSLDGKELIFNYWRRSGENGLMVMTADGRSSRLVASPQAGLWPPGREQYVVARLSPDLDMDVYLVNSRGRDRINLTNHPADDTSPVFSPDESQVAFLSNRNRFSGLYVMNSDGGRVRALSGEDLVAGDLPAWSPDGTQIAFVVLRRSLSEIVIAAADGSSKQIVSPFPAEYASPVWSPDGEQLAFVMLRGGVGTLYIMNADGSDLRQLTPPIIQDRGLAWRP